MKENEVIYNYIPIVEEHNEVTIDEVMPVIEMAEIESYNIQMQEAFPATEGNTSYNHALLNNREIHDAHPITSITGLREELDSIEALQTIYSDKKGNADYYEWANGHAVGKNGAGYFVTLNNDTYISICTGDDIFGVVVDSAAFVGGQDDVSRDSHYGLVATTGVVPVRCELDVVEGDYVVSNLYGVATKSGSNCGYKVVALRDIQGVPHAIIKLNITADQINLMGAEIKDLDSRMDAAETNIVSAVNVANQAYQKATEAGNVSADASNKAQNALDTSNKVLDSVGSLENAATQSQIIAAQAKAIAEGTMVSAEAMCQEAIDEANKALVEATELREEFKEKIEEIDAELDNTTLELETIKKDIIVTKEELQQSVEDVKKDVGVANDEIKQDIEDTKTSLKEAQEDVASLQEDIEPLVSWPEGSDNPTGIAGFVAQADENSARIGSLVERQGETDKSIAAFKQEVADNYATQTMLSEVGDNLVLFKQEVSDTYATQEMVSAVDDNLAKYKQEVTDTYATQEMVSSVDNALTSYKQEASKNYATQQMLSSVEDNLTDYKQEVTDTYATQKMVTTVGDNLANFKQEVKDDYATQEMLTNVDNALTSYKQEVTKNYATQQMVSSVENNLASYKQEVMDTYATQQMVTTVDNNLTSYKQEVTNTYATQEMVSKLETDTSKALADYKQEVKDGYATQEMVTSLETETGKALSDYKQEVGKTYATNTSLANLKTETTNAIAASKEEATATYASKSDLTSFETTTSSSMARIEQKADANGAYIQSTVANLDRYAVGPHSQAYGFTLEQAAEVLEEGMIYAPTEKVTEIYKRANKAIESKTTDDISKVYCIKIGSKRVYRYYGWNTSRNQYDWNGITSFELIPDYERTFLPGYLYKWGRINGVGHYGWTTVDKNYTSISYDETDTTNQTNTSGMSVYFKTDSAPAIATNSQWGYWYTNGETDATVEGTDVKYEPYTLYKWTESTATILVDGEDVVVKDEDGNPVKFYHWAPVATLAGNSPSRAVSQIRQDANSIEMNVTNLKGDYAGIRGELTSTQSAVQQLSAWKEGEESNMASVKTISNDDGAAVVISALQKNGENVEEMASLVLNVVEGENGTTSGLSIDADYINFKGTTTFASKDEVDEVRNNAIYQTETQFALSTSSEEFDACSEWFTEVPERQDDTYIWQRTVFTKGDKNTYYSNPTYMPSANGREGAPAYSVILTNESHVFAGNSEGKASGSTSTDVYVYKGSTAQNVQVKRVYYVEVTGNSKTKIVDGLFFTCVRNNTTYPSITIYVDTDFARTEYIIPITVEAGGKEFTKDFKFTIASAGKDGQDATSYWLTASDSVIRKAENGTLAPGSITFYGKSQTGTSGVTDYAGRWLVQFTVDGEEYSPAVLRDFDTTSAICENIKPSWLAIRCRLYQAGAMTVLLDEQTVPIISDGATGSQGDSVDNIYTRYNVSSNNTSPPSNESLDWTTSFDDVLTEYHRITQASSNVQYYIWSQIYTKYTSGREEYSEATVGSAESIIASWCKSEDKTKIDGGMIATGTIIADSIAAGAITTAKLDARAVTADKIDATNLTVESADIAKKITVSDANGNVVFSADGSNNKVEIGGWHVYQDELSSDITYYVLPDGTQKIRTGIRLAPKGTDVLINGINTTCVLSAGSSFGVTPGGALRAYSGTIGGWDLNSEMLRCGNVGLHGRPYNSSSNDDMVASLVDTSKSPIRIYAGSYNTDPYTIQGDAKFMVLDDGSVYAQAMKLGSGALGADDTIFLGTTDMVGSPGFFEGALRANGDRAGNAIDNWRLTVGSNFGVTSDGSLYASNAIIDGTITSNNATITGGFIRFDGDPMFRDFTQIDKNGICVGYEGGNSLYMRISTNMISVNDSMSLTGENQKIAFSRTTIDDGITLTFVGHLQGQWTSQSFVPVDSDFTKKHDILSLDNIYSQIFDKLNPVIYKYNNDISDRVHIGLVAQEVEDAVLSVGLTTKDLAAIYYNVDADGNKVDYGLCYEEFISLCVYEIQKLKARVAELEAQQNDSGE